MRTWIIAALLALSTGAANAETRALSGFTRVAASGGYDVNVAVGPAFTVNVTGPGADRVRTEVQGDTLLVHPVPGFHWGRRPRADISVTMPRVTGLETSSGADIDARGLNADALTLDASSGSDLRVAGACRTLDATSSSGADIDASALRCESGSADASSGSDIRVNVSGRLDVEASSGADIVAMGNPGLGDVSLSSGGSFHRQ